MMVAHCAYSLKILERSRFGLRHLLSVEVKRRHPAQQKIGRVGTKIRKPAKLGRGHADIFSHALHFLLPTAFQFESCRASSGPFSPPLRNSLGQRPAFLSNGQGEHFNPPPVAAYGLPLANIGPDQSVLFDLGQLVG
jgi:hypothetical protein